MKNLNPIEVLPFCTRCFGVGTGYGDGNENYCHECDSGGTCVPMERWGVIDLQNNINYRLDLKRRIHSIFE